MVDESGKGAIWAILVPSAIELALVLLWAANAAAATAPSNIHFQWYVELPLVFLAVPSLGLISAIWLIRRPSSADRACLIAALFWPLLAINLMAFLGYLVSSGGGM
jgi:hypothetical protein